MSTTDRPFHHTDELTATGTDLAAEIRLLNESGLAVPWVWEVTAPDPDDPAATNTLKVGVHNAVGALVWEADTETLVPATGTNPSWTTYHLAGLHDTFLPPQAEVPVADAYAALVQFLTTHRLPDTVTWRPAAPLDTLFTSGS